MKGKSNTDNVFLAIEAMDWAVETNQPMVMLLLDFEKAYDQVEWSFLEGSLLSLGFNQAWISWVRALYIDSWCTVDLIGQTSDPFKLIQSVHQGCLLVPFFYLFVTDCLGYLLD